MEHRMFFTWAQLIEKILYVNKPLMGSDGMESDFFRQCLEKALWFD